MTRPLQGRGRRFETARTHCFATNEHEEQVVLSGCVSNKGRRNASDRLPLFETARTDTRYVRFVTPVFSASTMGIVYFAVSTTALAGSES